MLKVLSPLIFKKVDFLIFFRHTAWNSRRNYMKKIFYLFSAVVALSVSMLSAAAIGSPVMLMDGNGNQVSVWQETTSETYYIKAATKAKQDANWTTPVVISDQSVNSYSPLLALDQSGNAVALWSSDRMVGEQLSRGLYSAQLPFGGSWSSITTLSPATQSVANGFQLRVTSTGDMSAFWQATDINTGAFNFFSTSATFGGSWSAPIQVSQL